MLFRYVQEKDMFEKYYKQALLCASKVLNTRAALHTK
jgi:hypothetical protein